jgi:hypothetical protein
MARGLHRSPNIFFVRPASLYFGERIYIYIYIYVCVCVCVCREIVYELPLLPSNIAVKYFDTNREGCEALTGYLSLGCRSGGDWENT